jgi:hypothetical protein
MPGPFRHRNSTGNMAQNIPAVPPRHRENILVLGVPSASHPTWPPWRHRSRRRRGEKEGTPNSPPPPMPARRSLPAPPPDHHGREWPATQAPPHTGPPVPKTRHTLHLAGHRCRCRHRPCARAHRSAPSCCADRRLQPAPARSTRNLCTGRHPPALHALAKACRRRDLQ